MKYLHLLLEAYKNMDDKNRLRWGIGIAALLLLAVLYSAADSQISRLEKKRAARESDLVQVMTLKQRYLSARMFSQKFSNRLASSRADDSPAKVIEEIGIKGKSCQITPLKGEQRGGFQEDAAEVKLEALTANEAINLVYRLENGTRPVVIKRAIFKTRFDDPSRLDVTLAVALLKSSPQGLR